MAKVLDSGIEGCGFDPHTGHGLLLNLRQFVVKKHIGPTIRPMPRNHGASV